MDRALEACKRLVDLIDRADDWYCPVCGAHKKVDRHVGNCTFAKIERLARAGIEDALDIAAAYEAFAELDAGETLLWEEECGETLLWEETRNTL